MGADRSPRGTRCRRPWSAAVGGALVVTVWASAGVALAQADAVEPTGLVERLAELEESVRDGEADLVAQARAALAETDTRRAHGDAAGAARSERIAEAAIGLIRSRRARADAALSLEAARVRRAELEARLETARAASAAAARERERLGGASGP